MADQVLECRLHFNEQVNVAVVLRSFPPKVSHGENCMWTGLIWLRIGTVGELL
jgi:hypothetical protein